MYTFYFAAISHDFNFSKLRFKIIFSGVPYLKKKKPKNLSSKISLFTERSLSRTVNILKEQIHF